MHINYRRGETREFAWRNDQVHPHWDRGSGCWVQQEENSKRRAHERTLLTRLLKGDPEAAEEFDSRAYGDIWNWD